MDQMKENYLTHMNLVLTHFCPNGALYGCCSQPLNCPLISEYYICCPRVIYEVVAAAWTSSYEKETILL